MKILLLEDDCILNEIIEKFLLDNNYTVVSVFDGNEAQNKAFEESFDLFILDVNVPYLNGFDFLKQLRQNHITTPAIFITSLNTSQDLKKGFDSGCDDYIKKPFEPEELLLRIQNIQRIFNLHPHTIYQIDEDITFNTQFLELNYKGIKTILAKKEAMILNYLIKHNNKIVSTQELCNNIWSYEEYPSAATIRTYIKNLRKLLGDSFITNIKGVGYRFNQR
jgi:DNA-binding response OmpR family regulator